VLENGFDSINESHTYGMPNKYSIEWMAKNDKSDSTSQVLEVALDYLETSFDGINTSIYKTSDKEILILTINMHTYQEKRQNEKFKLVTDLIGAFDIDFVALQECPQHKSAEVVEGVIKEDNMALVLKNRLKETYDVNYNFTWDWGHYGWNVWEEGLAILSKHNLLDTDSRYVSANKTKTDFTSRKVILGKYHVPNIGIINVLSAHTNWRTSPTSEEQNNQMRNIHSFVNEKTLSGQSVFVAGDFNGNPTDVAPWNEAYTTMIGEGAYVDTFLSANPDANNRPAQSKYHTILGDYPGRIDYIFMKQNKDFEVVDSQIVFTNAVIGEVSDHHGVITKFKYLK
jgi:maltose 6'-phosphate phosphatase